MTYTEYLTRVREILRQTDEGAVTEREAFNAIVFYAHGVEQIAPEPGDLDHQPDPAFDYSLADDPRR